MDDEAGTPDATVHDMFGRDAVGAGVDRTKLKLERGGGGVHITRRPSKS